MAQIRDQLIGVVLDGRYRIESVIARGGMAMVYRGTDLRLDREIAVKVMHAHLASDPSFVERFEREAMSAARLSHPNLISVNDQSRDGDVVYLVMEYLESVTLRKELKHRGRFTPRQAISVVDAILAALEAVHGAGMIHRDLKPDNVLLGTDGQIKLTDFGLARAVTSETTTKTLIGTVGYVAPELVTRSGADERTDIYTLGIMFYEMLTGSQPYTDDVPIQVAYRHVHDRVSPPSEAVPGLSPQLDALVLWATSPKPDGRPESAAAMRQALGEARLQMTDAELDFGGSSDAADPSEPALTATADIDEQIGLEAPEPVPGTGEIPKLDEDQSASSEAVPAAASAAAVPAVAAGEAAAGGTAPIDTPEDAQEDEDHEAEPGSRRRRPLLVGVIAAAAVIALVGAFGVGQATGIIGGDEPEEEQTVMVTIPQIEPGTAADEARKKLESAGFTVESDKRNDPDVKDGTFLETRPGAGKQVREGGSVVLVTSAGPETAKVPDITGKTEEEAAKALEDAGLKKGKVTQAEGEGRKGRIVAQSPDADSTSERGSAVDFTVSAGPKTTAIPDLRGQDYEASYKRLLGMGFRVARDDVYSDYTPKGKVVAMYPGQGKKRPADTLVILKVSKGKKPAEKPKKDDKKKDDKKKDDKPADKKPKDKKD